MSYLTQDEIASNASMQHRVAQAAAQEGTPNDPMFPGRTIDPDRWTMENRRVWAAAPGWSDAWEYARLTHEDTPGYDPGADEAVITDQQILSQIQSMLP
jgi:hypothetical protein